MEPQQEIEKENVLSPLNKVTPLSKYFALVIVILLPFIGGYVGYTQAQEKVVEMHKPFEVKKINQENIEYPHINYQDNGSVKVSMTSKNSFSITPENDQHPFQNAMVSPDNSWIYLESQSDSHGSKYRWIYDIEKKSLNNVIFQNDEDQYKKANPSDSEFDLRYMSYTKCPGWSIPSIPSTQPKATFLACQLQSGNIMPESGMGYMIYYKSVSTSTPWILTPDIS